MVWGKCREYRLHVQHDIPHTYDMYGEYRVAHAAGKHEVMLTALYLSHKLIVKRQY